MRTLDELDRLHAAATQGEWEVRQRDGWWTVRGVDSVAFDDGSACYEYANQCEAPTRDAIVALHNAWPSVSARLRAAEAEVERLRGVLRNVRDNYDCDEDAHRHGTICRRCDARAALGEP